MRSMTCIRLFHLSIGRPKHEAVSLFARVVGIPGFISIKRLRHESVLLSLKNWGLYFP